MTCHAGRLMPKDGTLVRFAVYKLHLEIIGRGRWGTRCPGCRKIIAKARWRGHRC